MSDEGAAFINQVINNMNPVFLTRKYNSKVEINSVDVSNRIGVGKGIIDNPADFDKWDGEIADLFEGINI